MKNTLIPNTLIEEKHRNYISVDHASYGIQIIIEANNTDELHLRMNDIIKLYRKELKLRATAFTNSLPMLFNDLDTNAGNIGYGIYPYNKEKNKFRIILFLNQLNGNKCSRNYLTLNHIKPKERKIINNLTANDSRQKIKNFLPIALYMNPQLKLIIPDVLRNKLPELIFSELEFARDIFFTEIKKLGLITHGSPLFKIFSIEINLDLLTLPGIEFATNEEIQVRLSRGTLLNRVGQFIKNSNTFLPIVKFPSKILKHLSIGPYYDENRNFIAGIPALYGYFYDKTELYVATKEKPQPFNSKKNLHITLGAWLTRFEWRLTQNDRFAQGELSDLISDYTDSEKTFETIEQFKSALNKLRDIHFDFLKTNLNAEFLLTAPYRLDWLQSFVSHIHPNSVINALFKFPFRINRHVQGIDQTKLGQLDHFELIKNLKSHYDQEYGLNWDYQPDIHLMDLTNLLGDLQEDNPRLNLHEHDFH